MAPYYLSGFPKSWNATLHGSRLREVGWRFRDSALRKSANKCARRAGKRDVAERLAE
jgi:hypothetical protein